MFKLESNFLKRLTSHFINKYDSSRVNVSSIVICGSVAVSLNLKNSDIDLLILVKDLEPFGRMDFGFLIEIVSGVRVEAGIISESAYTSMLGVIESEGLNATCPYPIDKFLHAIPIYQEVEYHKLRSNFCEEKFQGLAFEKFQRMSVGVFEDISGAIKEERFELVIFWVRDLVGALVESLLILKSNYYTREKWLSERLKREVGSQNELYLAFLNVMLIAPELNSISLNNWVVDSLKFCRTLQLSILFSGKREFVDIFSENDFPEKFSDFSFLAAIEKGKFHIFFDNRVVEVSEASAFIYLKKFS